MPELPEVETTLRGIEPHLLNTKVVAVEVRQASLRWPVTDNLANILRDNYLKLLHRRAKYLLFDFIGDRTGTLIIHLGMSGSLRLAQPDDIFRKHDHVAITFSNDWQLRFHDPRRFGTVQWLEDPERHPLLCHLGPEPLSEAFDGDYLFKKSRSRKVPVKQFLMDNQVVVGVGNIYASEALFRSGISPLRQAREIARRRYLRLADEVKDILAEAIEQGGTTLRDFVNGQGNPGYFKQSLQVYGKGAQPCRSCQRMLREVRLGGRATVYCSNCQR